MLILFFFRCSWSVLHDPLYNFQLYLIRYLILGFDNSSFSYFWLNKLGSNIIGRTHSLFQKWVISNSVWSPCLPPLTAINMKINTTISPIIVATHVAAWQIFPWYLKCSHAGAMCQCFNSGSGDSHVTMLLLLLLANVPVRDTLVWYQHHDNLIFCFTYHRHYKKFVFAC